MNELSALPAILASVLLIAAGLLAAIGALGLVRLPDFFMRMHPPAMGSTLGVGCVLIASMLVRSAGASRLVIHEVLITLFIVMTAPITAMLLARAALYRGGRRKRPGVERRDS